MDRDRILNLIVEQIRIVVPELSDVPMGASASMATLGLDSVSRQEVLLMSMEQLDLNLPLVQLFGPKNLGELAELLHSKLAR